MTADEKQAVRALLKAWNDVDPRDDPTNLDLFWWNYGVDLAERNLLNLCIDELGEDIGRDHAEKLIRIAERWERIYRPVPVLTR